VKVIHARNVQQALPLALDALRLTGVRRDSRNGPVIVFPEPVTTVYAKPEERVMFWAQRDANPFFHFAESLWMLAGRNDVEYVARFVGRMRSFSDDGVTFHGAYGHRWRRHFADDQLPKIIDALRADPDCRRQVLTMWDPRTDLGRKGKDLPCNLQCVFQIAVDGRLDMMVTNRSNDLVWGAYGANAVHFSMLHEYIARSIGVEVGVYRQVSANLHAYVNVLEGVQELADAVPDFYQAGALGPKSWASGDPYTASQVKPFPLWTGDAAAEWNAELDMFMEEPNALGFRQPFFRRVAVPMYRAFSAWKAGGPGRYAAAREALGECRASDWSLAANEWLTRREKRHAKAADDGVTYE